MSDKFLPIYDRSNQAMRTNTGKDYQWKIPTASMWTTSNQVLNLNALPSNWTELVAKIKVNTSLTYYDWSVLDDRTVTINRAFLIHILRDEIESDTSQPSNCFGVGSSRIVPSANSSVIGQMYDYNVYLYVTKSMVSISGTNYAGVYAYGKEVTSGISLDVVYR